MINCQSVYNKIISIGLFILPFYSDLNSVVITELADDPFEYSIVLANTPRTLLVNKAWHTQTKTAYRHYDRLFLIAATPMLHRNKLFNVPPATSAPEALHSFLYNPKTLRTLIEHYQDFLPPAVEVGHWQLVNYICTTLRTVLNPRMLVHPFNILPLHLAAQRNQDSVLRCLMFHGAPLNTQDPGQNTVLHSAVRAGSNDCIKNLLTEGIHPQQRNEQKLSTVGEACISGRSTTVRLLLNHLESLITRREYVDADPIAELRSAILNGNNTSAKELIKSGAAINMHDVYGRTALHYATMLNNETVVKLLLDYKANHSIPDTDKLLPLDCAAASGNNRITTLLIQADHTTGIRSKSKHKTALLALQKGHLSCFTLLNDVGYAAHLSEQELIEAYHYALSTHPRRIMPILLTMPRDYIDAPSMRGAHLLCVASLMGNTSLVRALLEHRANPNHAIKHQKLCFLRTPLHCAAAQGHGEIVNLLLNYRANSTLVDEHGRTPLILAAAKGHQSAVLELLAHEASTQEKEKALMRAIVEGQTAVAQTIIDSGVLINKEYCWSSANQLAIKSPTRLISGQSYPLINIAAALGHGPIIQLLLARNAAALLDTDTDKKTLLAHAQSSGDRDAIRIIQHAISDTI